MKVLCLRSVFQTVAVGFPVDVEFQLGTVSARFVQSVTLPMLDVSITGRDASGKEVLDIRCVDRKFTGSPYLMEVLANENREDLSGLWDVRRILAARTEAIAAFINWVCPGIVGRFLVDALFNRDLAGSENTWDWKDVQPMRVPKYRADPQALVDAMRAHEREISALQDDARRTVIMAMRWRYRVDCLWPSVDKYAGLWVGLDAIGTQVSRQGGIKARIREVLERLYPDGPAMTATRRKALLEALCKTRHKIVHLGDRDLPDAEHMVKALECVLDASIRYLLDGGRPQPPPGEDMFQELGM